MKPVGEFAVGPAARSAALTGHGGGRGFRRGVGVTAEADPFGYGRVIEEEMLLTVT